jgi:hypothetical protein
MFFINFSYYFNLIRRHDDKDLEQEIPKTPYGETNEPMRTLQKKVETMKVDVYTNEVIDFPSRSDNNMKIDEENEQKNLSEGHSSDEDDMNNNDEGIANSPQIEDNALEEDKISSTPSKKRTAIELEADSDNSDIINKEKESKLSKTNSQNKLSIEALLVDENDMVELGNKDDQEKLFVDSEKTLHESKEQPDQDIEIIDIKESTNKDTDDKIDTTIEQDSSQQSNDLEEKSETTEFKAKEEVSKESKEKDTNTTTSSQNTKIFGVSYTPKVFGSGISFSTPSSKVDSSKKFIYACYIFIFIYYLSRCIANIPIFLF